MVGQRTVKAPHFVISSSPFEIDKKRYNVNLYTCWKDCKNTGFFLFPQLIDTPHTSVNHSPVLSLGHIGQHSECHHWRHLMLEYFSVLWTCWKWYSKLISIVAHFSFNKLNLVSALQLWFLLCLKSRSYSYLKYVGGVFESAWKTKNLDVLMISQFIATFIRS